MKPVCAWIVLGAALCPAFADAQEESPPADEAQAYEVRGPGSAPGQRVGVKDSFQAELQLGKRGAVTESGFVQEYEDLFLRPQGYDNQLNAQRTWRSAKDLSGRVDGEVADFECAWGLGPTGLYYQRLQDHELPPLVSELLRAERDQAGCRQGSLDMPAGVIPAIPVQVGQTWDVDPLALAHWGRVGFGTLLIPRRSSARLAAVTPGKSGPVLELRFKGEMSLSRFFPLGVESPISRPTSVKVDAKVLQPCEWVVGGDPFLIQLKAQARVSMPDGEEQRVVHTWTREVRRLE